jgi:hypothetical protein
MKRQHGLSLGIFILVCFLLVLTALVGFKLATPYMEYFTIQKAFKAIAADPELKTRKDVENAFQRRTMIDSITHVSPADLDIEIDGSDIQISSSYSVKVPLVANISLFMDFNASSSGN